MIDDPAALTRPRGSLPGEAPPSPREVVWRLLRFRRHGERVLLDLVDASLANPVIARRLPAEGLTSDELRRTAWADRREILARARAAEDRYRRDLSACVRLHLRYWHRRLTRGGALVVAFTGCVVLLQVTGGWNESSFLIGTAVVGVFAMTVESEWRQRFGDALAIDGAPRHAALNATAIGLTRWRAALNADGVLPYLRKSIEERLEAAEPYSTRLRTVRWAGLRSLDRPSFHVPTAEGIAMMDFIERGEGCVCAIHGPRGSGKTDLLRAICAGRYPSPPERRDLRVRVEAGNGDTAEQLLTGLYKELCTATMRYFPRPARHVFSRRSRRPVDHRPLDLSSRRAWRRPHHLAASVSRRLAQEITVTEERTSTGEVGLLGSGKFAQKQTVAVKTNLELPELRAFVDMVASALAKQRPRLTDVRRRVAGDGHRIRPTGILIVCVDHLQRLGAAEAHTFLTVVRDLFAAGGRCLLVTSSGEALAARVGGVPLRELFEHEVEMKPFDLADSARLIERRVSGFSRPFVALAHCLSDGSPESVRSEALAIARCGDAGPEGMWLGEVAARRAYAQLDRARRELREATGRTDVLLRRVADITEQAVIRRRAALFHALDETARALARGGDRREPYEEFAAHMYRLAAVLDTFDDSLTAASVDYGTAVVPEGPHGPERSRFDLLAKARRCASARDPDARRAVDRFRGMWADAAGTQLTRLRKGEASA